jgi:hypothetical protein
VVSAAKSRKGLSPKGIEMARTKGVKPKVTLMNDIAKVQPIPRGRDNTDDLLDAVEAVHVRKGHVRFPDNVRTGSFDPGDNTAYNGNTVVAPTT